MVDCVPNDESILGAAKAAAKLENYDFTTDGEAVKKLNLLGTVSYERVMAKEIQKGGVPYSFEIAQPELAKSAKDIASDFVGRATNSATWLRASEYFGDRFYDTISKPIRKIHAEAVVNEGELLKKGEQAPSAKARFLKEVVPKLNGITNEITRLGGKYKGKAFDDAMQKAFGIRGDQAYEAISYVNWLKKAPMYDGTGDGVWSHAFKNTNEFVSRNAINWTILNAGDYPRILTPYLTKPGVMMKGLIDTFTDGGPFSSVAAISDHNLPRTMLEKLDTFSAANRAQERLAYFLDRADGGDGLTGVRKNAFMYDNWDATGMERHSNFGAAGRQGLMGLGRFLLAETNWNFRNYQNMVSLMPGMSKVTGKPFNPRMAVNYLSYTAIKVAMFGPKAALPALLWDKLVPKDNEWNKPDGIANKLATEIIHAIGGEGEVDLGEIMQPFGLINGAKYQQLANLKDTATNSVASMVDGIAKGNPTKAGVDLATGLIAISSVIGWGKRWNLEKYKDVGLTLANGTTLKAMKAVSKGMDEGWDIDRIWDEILSKEIPGGLHKPARKKHSAFGGF